MFTRKSKQAAKLATNQNPDLTPKDSKVTMTAIGDLASHL